MFFDGGHGGSIAGAVRAVFEEYFKDRILAGDPNYASKSESFRKYVLGNPLTKNKENSTENNTNTANTNTGENNSSNNSTNNSQSNSATGNIQNQTVPATD